MPKRIHNGDLLKERRQELRNNATPAEKQLWNMLRNSAIDGRKFRRQHSIGCYIVDFYCPSERLAIELDGDHHFTEEGRKYDEIRTKYLNDNFVRVLRFENQLVINEPEEIISTIRAHFNVYPLK